MSSINLKIYGKDFTLGMYDLHTINMKQYHENIKDFLTKNYKYKLKDASSLINEVLKI